MGNRFQGADRRRLVSDALSKQQTLQCSSEVIARIEAVADVECFEAGKSLIVQDADDNRIAFILSGEVDILIGGTKVASRGAGQHVGEMSLIDPSARRSASVVALKETCVAWVDEAAFSKIAEDHSFLWRQLALELGDRLRQRGALVRSRNTKPIIFVGSSKPSLRLAKAIVSGIEGSSVEIRLWSESVFGASETTIESLEKTFRDADFAVLVLAPDDHLSRPRRTAVPRDNVILELGMSIGGIERRRTLMVVQDPAMVKLPSDLKGVTYLEIAAARTARRRSIDQAITKINSRVTELGPR